MPNRVTLVGCLSQLTRLHGPNCLPVWTSGFLMGRVLVQLEFVLGPSAGFDGSNTHPEASEHVTRSATGSRCAERARTGTGAARISERCRADAAGARQERTQSPACRPRAKAQLRRVGLGRARRGSGTAGQLGQPVWPCGAGGQRDRGGWGRPGSPLGSVGSVPCVSPSGSEWWGLFCVLACDLRWYRTLVYHSCTRRRHS